MPFIVYQKQTNSFVKIATHKKLVVATVYATFLASVLAMTPITEVLHVTNAAPTDSITLLALVCKHTYVAYLTHYVIVDCHPNETCGGYGACDTNGHCVCNEAQNGSATCDQCGPNRHDFPTCTCNSLFVLWFFFLFV